MRSVLKFPAPPPEAEWEFEPLPAGAEIVHFGADPQGRVCIWALIEMDPGPDHPVADDGVKYTVFGTGQDVPEGCEHIRSAVCPPFVWHLFRRQA